MIVHTHLEEAFKQSLSQHGDIFESWRKASHRIGGKLFPDTLLEASIQNIGWIDILLRSLEDEIKIAILDGNTNLLLGKQMMLSQMWISDTYEIFRNIKSNEMLKENKIFKELEHHLRLLRVPIDKHQIASDHYLKKKPQLIQVKPANDNGVGQYEHHSGEPYKLVTKLTGRGSLFWETVDGKTGKAITFERLYLSERILKFFDMDEFA